MNDVMSEQWNQESWISLDPHNSKAQLQKSHSSTINSKQSQKAFCIILLELIILLLIFNSSLSKKTSKCLPLANADSQGNLRLLNDQKFGPSTTWQESKMARQGSFPRIFWIYTENEFDSNPMMEQVYLQYFNHTATLFGYEVRLANSWNSYDWLSEKTTLRISKAMQNSRVDEPVHNILKMALLMENGGILVNQLDLGFLGEDFSWVEEMFDPNIKDFEAKYGCDPSKADLYMLPVDDDVYGTKYIDSFVAAFPQSLVLRQAFDLLINFIISGKFPFDVGCSIIQRNTNVGVDYLPNSFQQTINIVLGTYQRQTYAEQLCHHHDLQYTKKKTFVLHKDLGKSMRRNILMASGPEESISRIEGQENVRLVLGLNHSPIPDILNHLIHYALGDLDCTIPHYERGSLLSRILETPKNKQVFLETLPEREVELCVIIAKEIDKSDVDRYMHELLQSQTYTNWKQIMFVEKSEPIPHSQDSRLIFVHSSGNPIRNIEIAVTKHCGKQSYAVLLKPKEKFSSDDALLEIAKATAPQDVVGAFISLNSSTGRLLEPSKGVRNFRRTQDGFINPKNVKKMEEIVNHMRIFSAESFRYFPQFDLRDIYGKYFKSPLIFLMNLLEMIRNRIDQPAHLYIIKRYSSVWNVPRRVVFIKSSITVQNVEWEQLDTDHLKRTDTKYQCEAMEQTMNSILLWKIPFSKMIVLNNGDEFTPVDEKKGPEIIPKIIHQAWIGTSQLPAVVSYCYQKAKVIYPNYQIKLWRQKDITRENFPLTYDIMTTLMNFNKHSPYDKMATIVDIMRREVLLHNGGFWKAANQNMLRPIFDKLTKYKIVIPVDRNVRYRWLQAMCLFGSAPKIQNLWRVSNYRNLNRMRIYHSWALAIAGPIDFSQFVTGYEQYDPEILCMAFQTFYPAQTSQYTVVDRCLRPIADLKEGESYEFIQRGLYLLSNCSDIYPNSYGVQHTNFGGSWVPRRNLD